MTERVEVDLEPIGRRIEVPTGTTILAAAQAAGVDLASICGGMGTCGACRIRLIEGSITPPTPTEIAEMEQNDLNAGYRLACQAKVLDACKLDIPPESLTTAQRLQVEGQELPVDLDPVVVPIDVVIPPPGLHDLRSDLTRLRESLARLGLPSVSVRYPGLISLSRKFRQFGWTATLAVRGTEIIAVLPSPSLLFGFAVDVGTTKLAAYLVNLVNGETVAKSGAMNPQIAYGEDVISRIAYANDNLGGQETLQHRLIATLNNLIDGLSHEAGVSRDQIVEAVIVGNTAMHHLFVGLPVNQLGTAPYVPSVSEALEIPADSIGLEINPAALVYLPPNIAGYVGADHVAMLLASKAAQDRQEAHTIISLDIGTNTEISLYHWGRHLSCSCASGPAFEGAHIRDGMRAAPGAIERVRIVDGKVQIQTIEHQAPVGICGSGILDVVAELLTAKLIDRRGVFSGESPLLRKIDRSTEFVLADADNSGNGRDIVVTRKDVNEIQLAKGAIRAGVELLLSDVGVVADEIDEFIIAGAFGTYLDLESAIKIGMFPDLPRSKFKQVGNAAGLGAKGLLISLRQRKLAKEIVKSVEYIELTTHPGFTEAYMDALAFGI